MNAYNPISSDTAPRIYAACLASYNAGRLYGAWIDCEGKDKEALALAIDDMLASSPCPNVMRRKCEDCGHYQTDSRPYGENSDECGNCGAPLSAEFKPSAEEWAIHDHEGFCGLITSEWPDLGEVAAAAEGLAGDHRAGFIWLCDDLNMKPSEALDKAEEVIVWTWPHSSTLYPSDERMLAEYAQEFYEETGGLPDNLPEEIANNIDWHGIAQDWKDNGAIALADIEGERVLIANAGAF